MSNLIRVVRAGFTAGALFCAVALSVNYWAGVGAALLAGLIAFYFEESCQRLAYHWERLKEPHPFAYPAIALWTLGVAVMLGLHISDFAGVVLFGILGAFVAFGLYWLLFLWALVGAYVTERARWHGNFEFMIPFEFEKLGLKEMPLTYRNAYRWMFKLLHHNQGLVYAVDGVIGGIVAASLHSFDTVMPVLVVLLGGLLGVLVGVAHYELVSKRVFGYGRA